MTNDSPTGIPQPTGTLSMIERAAHFPTVLLILAFLLALDTGISFGYQGTLLSLSWSFAQQYMTIGHVLIFFVAFGLYMSVGVALARYIADLLARCTVLPLWNKLFRQDDNSESPYRGDVRPWKLREVAHIEQNNFYLDIYKEHEALRLEDRGSEWRIASTAFACLLLGGINYVLLPKLGYPSLSHRLASDFPDTWEWILALLSSLLLAIWLMPILRNDRAGEWVYCLSLYCKLEDEKTKAREQGLHPRF